MIPRKIWTCWFGEEMPPLVKMCVDSQLRVAGYIHEVIGIDLSRFQMSESKYIKECLNSPYPTKKWCKLSDYLRMYYLYNFGGIYLDADVQVMPGKNFDGLLYNKMFAGRERNGWIGSAVIGAEPNHPFIKKWMETVETNFKGDDDKCFESSMELLAKGYHEWNWDTTGFGIYTDDFFYPYNHEDGTVNYTKDTICYHH